MLQLCPSSLKTKTHTDTPCHHLTTHLLVTPLVSNTPNMTVLCRSDAAANASWVPQPDWVKDAEDVCTASTSPLSLSALQLHMPDICIDQRQRSHEEEVGSVLNLRLNHIKTALCNFLNNLTRAAPTETDHALCPNIEPCPPNGRENRRFVSLHAILALYCLAGIIAAFHDFLLGALLFICHNHWVCIQLLYWNDLNQTQWRQTKRKIWIIYLP